MIRKTTNLFLREGVSDKVYNVHLEERAEGWAVIAYNGRRGKSLVERVKGVGLTLAKAEAMFDKLVASKIKGGYTESPDGIAFSSSELAGEHTGFKAQLLNEISLEQARELGDDWLAQEKHDGERRGIDLRATGPIFANRRGLTLGVQSTVHEALAGLREHLGYDLDLDGEDMGARIVIFDIRKHPEMSDDAPFHLRAARLFDLHLEVARCGLDDVIDVEVAIPASEFFGDRLAELQNAKKEGFVLRHRDSVYTAGRPNTGGDALKVKFWKDITCRVAEGRDGKRSVALELLDAAGEWTSVGNVTIPANAEIPEVGSFIDVRYLYAYEGGSLYQPIFTRPRPDIEPSDCRIDRLSFKPAEPEPVTLDM